MTAIPHHAICGAEEGRVGDVRGPADGDAALRPSSLTEPRGPASPNIRLASEIRRLANVLGHEHGRAGERSGDRAAEGGFGGAHAFTSHSHGNVSRKGRARD